MNTLSSMEMRLAKPKHQLSRCYKITEDNFKFEYKNQAYHIPKNDWVVIDSEGTISIYPQDIFEKIFEILQI